MNGKINNALWQQLTQQVIIRMRAWRFGCVLCVCLVLIGCGQRVEPEKIVLQRLSWYPEATALTKTITTEYVLVQFTTTDSFAEIRNHYREKLPGFRLREGSRERLRDEYGDFDFLYVEGREAQVIVVKIEPAGAGEQTVKVYIYERTFRF